MEEEMKRQGARDKSCLPDRQRQVARDMRHSCGGRNPVVTESEIASSPMLPAMTLLTFLLVTCFLFLAPCPLPLVPAVHAASVDDVVNDLQARLSGIQSVKGAFSQTSYLKDLEREERYSGSFFIKKPSQLMWEYKTPRDEKVIINGTETWIYKRSEKQAIKTGFSKEAYSQVPIALLNSLENIRTDFDIALAEKDVLKLRPKHQLGFIREIILKASSKGFPVKSLKVFDTYGNIITIELIKVEVNPKLDDALFQFTPPPGVEVFDMNQ